MKVYLDYASTTPMDARVIAKMTEVMSQHYGNPSSVHSHGRKTRSLIEEARKTVANIINASTAEVFFTSSATEANNMVLKCCVRDLGVQRIISSPTEHHCVLHCLETIDEESDIEIIYLDVDRNGHVDLNQLRELAKQNIPTLVSLMHVNNEIGTKLNIEEVAQICAENKMYFHSDTVQSLGKFPIDVSNMNINFISASAHKFYGPKGSGFLYIKNDNSIKPLIYGGAQERNMRAGTENLYGIVGFAEALKLADDEMTERLSFAEELRTYFIAELESKIGDIVFNSPRDTNYSPYVLSVSFGPSPKNSLLMLNMDIAGVSVSAGSACSSGVEQDSHVLTAIGAPAERKSVRFSFSHLTTKEELDFVIEKLVNLVPQAETVNG